jgi:hypothetical protein
MTNVKIKSIQPDGLAVSFNEPFIFDTWEEAFNFIIAVEKANGWVGDVKIEQAKMRLK